LKGQRIQVEFVSANPTGPMTIANARGGPIGDVLASVLAFHGATVTREHYVNDRGGRVEVLGESVAVRYRELGGDTSVPFPEDGYPAEYITEVAKRIRAEDGDAYEALPFAEQARIFTTKAQRWFVDGFKVTTERLGIHFDSWFFESELMDSGYFRETLAALGETGHLEERDGAVWRAWSCGATVCRRTSGSTSRTTATRWSSGASTARSTSGARTRMATCAA